jgi:hypothetical protein
MTLRKVLSPCVVIVVVAFSALAGVTFSKPALLTSAGQSSDIAVVKALLNTKLKLGVEVKPLAQVEDLAGAKTLIVVVGASTKGLGAAGLDIDKETSRTKALLKAAKEKGIQILALHTGGEARRGKTSNDLIEIVVPQSQQVVVVASGNKDKIFTNLASKAGIPLAEVESLAAAGEAVKAAFKE